MTTPTVLTPSQAWADIGKHHLHLLNNPWYRTVATLQTIVSEATVDFWRHRGARTLHLPLTTGSISSPMGRGSDSTPVSVEIGGAATYLADSMQFMLELGCRLTGTDTYYVMPSFRGEPNDSTHLSQFFHSEAEIFGGLDDVIAVVQDYLGALGAALLDGAADEIRCSGGNIVGLERLANEPIFARVTFEEAAAIAGDQILVNRGWRTFSREAERTVMDRVGEFVWVTEWDHLAVPFYQAFGDSEAVALNGDLLFGPGEVVGAGQRHRTDLEVLRALELHDVGPETYQWYMDIRRLDPRTTAGFGMGIERFLMWVLNHDDIRDLQLLPRASGVNIVP
jgi:asparaginyl-tRNA synthetase